MLFICTSEHMLFIFQGEIMYEIIGTGVAPSYFNIDDFGRIFVRTNFLRFDTGLSYTVSLQYQFLCFT